MTNIMDSNRIYINKLAFEVNVGSYRIIEFLREQFPNEEIDSNNTKSVCFYRANLIRNYFKKDIELKSLADDLKLTYGYKIDRNFTFIKNEKTLCKKEYDEYVEAIESIKQLEKREGRYKELDSNELNVLLKLKYSVIKKIQDFISEYRIEEEDKINQIKTGLINKNESGNTLYWNLD